MTPVAPPTALLPAKQLVLVRSAAAAAEKAGQLTPEVLALIHREGWFRVHVPKAYGGPEAPLPQTVRLLEAIARADGSTGWTVTLCSGAGWFGGFLLPALSREVFREADVCLAGTGAATGTAQETGDGYRVTGHWRHASGALHATHFTANCRMLAADGSVLTEPDGQPVIRPFVFLREEVSIVRSWRCFGMVATGSHSFEVAGRTVPRERCFLIDPAAAVIAGPLYRYPFLQLAETTLAVNLSGMALHFLDACRELFAGKPATPGSAGPSRRQQVLHHAEEELARARAYFYTALDHSWEVVAQRADGTAAMNAVSAASQQLATVARQTTETLYPYCGLQAADPETELNRIWRDLHTASQHSLLVD